MFPSISKSQAESHDFRLPLFVGIFAAAQIVLPKDCKGNKFCEIMKMIVGPTIKWYITGQFEWKKIRVATGFANVRIYDGLYFHKLELYVEVSCYRNNFLVTVSSTTTNRR